MSMPGKCDKTLLQFIKERMVGVGARNANFIAEDVTRVNGVSHQSIRRSPLFQ